MVDSRLSAVAPDAGQIGEGPGGVLTPDLACERAALASGALTSRLFFAAFE